MRVNSNSSLHDIQMSEPNEAQIQQDMTPSEKILKMFDLVQEDPSMFEQTRSELIELLKNMDRSSLILMGQNRPSLTPTYAQKTAKQNSPKMYTKEQSKTNKSSSVFVKMDEAVESKNVYDDIKKKVQPDKENISVTKMSIVNKNLIKITTESKDDASKLKTIIHERIKNVQVEEEKKLQPRIIVFGVDSETSDEEIIEQIYSNNLNVNTQFEKEIFKKHCKVIKRTKVTNGGQQNIILEIHPSIRSNLFIGGVKRVKINWRKLSWKDSVFVLRCKKCCRAGHHHTTCENNQVCSRCGLEGHSYDKCQKFKDSHCHFCGSSSSKHPQEIEHELGDQKCSFHTHAVNRMKQRIEYDESSQL